MIYHRYVAKTRYLDRRGSKMPNSFKGFSFSAGRIMKLSHHLCNHESFDFSCMGNVRANAKIDHGPAAIYCSGGAIGDFGLNQILLIFVVLLGNEIDEEVSKHVEPTLNISRSFSLVTTRRSNFCFSFTASSLIFSKEG